MQSILRVVLTIGLLYGLFSLLPDEEGVYEVGFWGGLILWGLGLSIINSIEEFFNRISNDNEFVNYLDHKSLVLNAKVTRPFIDAALGQMEKKYK